MLSSNLSKILTKTQTFPLVKNVNFLTKNTCLGSFTSTKNVLTSRTYTTNFNKFLNENGLGKNVFQSRKFAVLPNEESKTTTIPPPPSNPLLNANTSQSSSGETQKPIIVQLATSKYDPLKYFLGLIVPPIILFSLFYYWMENTLNEDDGEEKVAKAHSVAKNVTTSFDDVKGVDEAKEELQEVVDYLKNPEKYNKLGAKLPKGILLVGEPGTGKTLLARAIAGEAGVSFLYVSGSAFDEMYVGVGPRRVRDLFKEARALSPCIIFIDELDAVGVSRKYNISGNFAKESTLNQLLTEMDGFKPTDDVIVIAATNLPHILDAALTRPGRFDKQVNVSAPDIVGRKEILDLYLKNTKPADDVNTEVIARGTTGFTGAELSNLINVAAIKAAVAGLTQVDMKTIEEAKDDIIMGGRRSGMIQTEEDKRITAYHEGGHALVALYSEGALPIHKATIVHRGNALGVTSFLPERDEVSISKKQLYSRLKVSMGGRAAEELIFGKDNMTTGSSSDFAGATRTARQMVSKLGFSEKVGVVYHDGETKISESAMEMIDSEVKRLLDESYTDSMKILKDHERELHLLAKSLLENETLSAEEIRWVISGKKLDKLHPPRNPPSKPNSKEKIFDKFIPPLKGVVIHHHDHHHDSK